MSTVSSDSSRASSRRQTPSPPHITTLADIPTLEYLYSSSSQSPTSQSSDQLFTPSAKLNSLISVHRGDITLVATDAIVNAANSGLLGGGGVDGAIHRAGGRRLYDACEALDGCATGSAKITPAFSRLACRFVIHAVGPVYFRISRERAEELLRGCYETSLRLAVENGCKSVAFSGISTGVYGYPPRDAALIATATVRKFLEEEGKDKIERVVFVTFVTQDVRAYSDALP